MQKVTDLVGDNDSSVCFASGFDDKDSFTHVLNTANSQMGVN